MSNEIAPVPEEFSREKVELIKRTIAVGATDDELHLFIHACKRTGLDPLMKQIYAVKRWNAQAGREVMSVQTGIDGYRLIADRTGKLAGISDALFDDESGDFPNKASVTVKKLIDGAVAEFTATARWKEYVQVGKSGVTAMWKKMPYLMLGKCAEALALRKGFPAELSGVYTAEEMAQADNDKQRDEVYAEVERQNIVAQPEPKSAVSGESIPPELDWSYTASSGLLICRLTDVKLSKKKKGEGELLTLQINRPINGKRIVYYFHNTHRKALLAAAGKVVKILVTQSGEYLQVSEVLEISGVKVESYEGHEVKAKLLASVLEMLPGELETLYEQYCQRSWLTTVEWLEKRKAELDAEAK